MNSLASRCFSAMYAGSPTRCSSFNSDLLKPGRTFQLAGLLVSLLLPTKTSRPKLLRKATSRPYVRLHRQIHGVTTNRNAREAATATPVQLLPRFLWRNQIHAPRKGNVERIAGLVRADAPHNNP